MFFFVVSPCEEKADICLIIDSSGSIRHNNPADKSHDNWHLVLQFTVDLVDYFTIGPDATRVGVIVFSENVRMEFPLNQHHDREQLKAALRNMQYEGHETNTPEAFRMARQQCFSEAYGDRRDVQNLAVIMTDGVPYPEDRRAPAISEAQVLRSYGTKIFAIGITNLIDINLLRDLSSPPHIEDRNYFTSPSFTALNEISSVLGQAVCATPTPGKGLFTSCINRCWLLLKIKCSWRPIF